jgi:hypothetical protein
LRVNLGGARTVSVRSTFNDESNRRIFKAPLRPPAANRDGSRSGHFKRLEFGCENFRRAMFEAGQNSPAHFAR